MNVDPPPVALSGPQRLGALLVPWTFVVILAALYAGVVLPRVREGHLLALCAGLFAASILCVMVIAAVTFSRDVLTGRWP